LRTTPDDDVDDDDDEAPAPVDTPPLGGGVGGVDDESKKLKLKSEVVSKLTSVVTWWWRLDSVTREPEPNPPIDWSILNTSIFSSAFFLSSLIQLNQIHPNRLGVCLVRRFNSQWIRRATDQKCRDERDFDGQIGRYQLLFFQRRLIFNIIPAQRNQN
jgi:hypothetical protein